VKRRHAPRFFGEIESRSELDCNYNTVPDSCECLADLSEDSRVDGADLAIVLAFWGNPKVFPRADINQDGAISGGHIGEILNSWGECP
jgi:hypothetical protein